MKLLDYLQEKMNLERDILFKIEHFFEQKYIPKGTILLEEGCKTHLLYYFEKGIARTFYNKDGKEVTHFFFTEKMFYTPLQNIIQGHPSNSMEVLEDSIVWEANFFEVEKFIYDSADFHKFKEYVLGDLIQKLNKKLYGLQFQTAKERYEMFLQEYPQILQRVPLGHIASFLGITQQRLSVIRAER